MTQALINQSNDDYDDINDRGDADVDGVDWNLHLFHLICDAHFQSCRLFFRIWMNSVVNFNLVSAYF